MRTAIRARGQVGLVTVIVASVLVFGSTQAEAGDESARKWNDAGVDPASRLAQPSRHVDPRALAESVRSTSGLPRAEALDLTLAVLEGDFAVARAADTWLRPELEAIANSRGSNATPRDAWALRSQELAKRSIWQLDLASAVGSDREAMLQRALESQGESYYLPYAAIDRLVDAATPAAEAQLQSFIAAMEMRNSDVKLLERSKWGLEAIALRRQCGELEPQAAKAAVVAALQASATSRGYGARDYRVWLLKTLGQLGAVDELRAVARDPAFDDVGNTAAFLAGEQPRTIP